MSIARAGHLATLTRVFRKRNVKVNFFEDLDLALEDGESRLLTRNSPTPSRLRRVRFEECHAVRGMAKREVGILKRLLVRKFFRRGDVIIRAGDTPSEMYILVSGSASVSVSMESAARKRIATFSPGMMFTDMAILDRLPRSADVTADSEMEVLALPAEQFDSLASLHPRLQMLLLRNLSLALARRVREANTGLLNF